MSRRFLNGRLPVNWTGTSRGGENTGLQLGQAHRAPMRDACSVQPSSEASECRPQTQPTNVRSSPEGRSGALRSPRSCAEWPVASRPDAAGAEIPPWMNPGFRLRSLGPQPNSDDRLVNLLAST